MNSPQSSNEFPGFLFYKSKGCCLAIKYDESIGDTMEFYFQASWGEARLCQYGDYIACPVNDGITEKEIYRIEKDAFYKTYQKS